MRAALGAVPVAFVVLVAFVVAGTGLVTPPRAQGQGQLPAYGARVEVVRLHVAVLDDGRPVTDLTARDFVVIDNGVEHEVALALTPTETPIDVALVIDQSDSIRQGAPTVKRDARAFLDALGPDDCAFVLPFQHRVGPGIWGPSMAPSLLQIIDLARLEGGTSLNDAVIVGLSEVQRWSVPGVLADRVVTEYRQPTIEGGVGINLGVGTAAAPEPEVTPETAPEAALKTALETAPKAALNAALETASKAASDKRGFGRADLPFRLFASNVGCGGVAGANPGDRRKALVVLTDGVDTTSAHTFGELLGFVYQSDVPVFPVAIGHPGASRAPSGSRELRRAARIAEGRLKKLAAATGGKYALGSGSSLKDKSAHSIVLKDKVNVEKFADFIQSVIDKEHKLVSTKILEYNIEIVKE